MQVLLINQNATIDRLVSLSTGKLLHSLDKVQNISDAQSKDYDFIIIDSDLYNDEEFEELKKNALGATTIMTLSKNFEKPSGIDIFIEKPFLPTELVDILSTARVYESVPEDDKLHDLDTIDSVTDLHSLPSLDDTLVDHSTLSDLSDDMDMPLSDLSISDEENDEDEINLDELTFDEGKEQPESENEVQLDNIDVPDIDDEISINYDDPIQDEEISFEGLEDASEDEDELNLDELGISDNFNSAVEADSEIPSFGEEEVEDAEEEPVMQTNLDIDENDADFETNEPLQDKLEELDSLEDEPLPDETADVELEDTDEEFSFDKLNKDNYLGQEMLDTDSDTQEDEITLDLDNENQEDKEDSMPQHDDILKDFAGLDEDILDEDLQLEDETNSSKNDLPEEENDEDEKPVSVPSSIFGDDEVQKLKDLLGDVDGADTDNNEESIHSPTDLESIDSLDSLSEASVAEALGLETKPVAGQIEELDEIPEKPSTIPVQQAAVQSGTTADIFSMPIDRLKELLEVADISVNITLKKKS